MAVDIRGHADRRMAEDLTDHLELDPLGEHEAGGRVPELVGVPVAESGLLTDHLELPVEVPRIDRCTDRRREHVAGILPGLAQGKLLGGPAGPVCSERGDHGSGQVESSAASCRLGVGDDELPPSRFSWRLTFITPASRSMSVHRSPSVSPRRMPVDSIRA